MAFTFHEKVSFGGQCLVEIAPSYKTATTANEFLTVNELNATFIFFIKSY